MELLGVPGEELSELKDPAAAAKVVSRAFRGKARELHPDVAQTKDSAAFLQARSAFELLMQRYVDVNVNVNVDANADANGRER